MLEREAAAAATQLSDGRWGELRAAVEGIEAAAKSRNARSFEMA